MPPLPPVSETSFLDANTFYYDVVAQGDISTYCSQVIEEVLSGQRKAITTSIAMCEAVHKVMFSEIVTAYQRPRAGLLSWVKSHPESIRGVSGYLAAAEKFGALPLTIVPVDARLMLEGARVAAATGLLINDAIILAVMREHGIRHLVTNDDDFNGVAGIEVWKPR